MNKKIWSEEAVSALLDTPLMSLIHQSFTVHKTHFSDGDMEYCSLSSIKTGACPEDCHYCPQSGHYNTQLKKEPLKSFESIMAEAKLAKSNGATRFCMGAAWRNPPEKDFQKVLDILKGIKKLELETCMTLGRLTLSQAKLLKENGLDFYNHNIDTSPNYYKKIITTRTFEARLETLEYVERA